MNKTRAFSSVIFDWILVWNENLHLDTYQNYLSTCWNIISLLFYDAQHRFKHVRKYHPKPVPRGFTSFCSGRTTSGFLVLLRCPPPCFPRVPGSRRRWRCRAHTTSRSCTSAPGDPCPWPPTPACRPGPASLCLIPWGQVVHQSRRGAGGGGRWVQASFPGQEETAIFFSSLSFVRFLRLFRSGRFLLMDKKNHAPGVVGCFERFISPVGACFQFFLVDTVVGGRGIEPFCYTSPRDGRLNLRLLSNPPPGPRGEDPRGRGPGCGAVPGGHRAGPRPQRLRDVGRVHVGGHPTPPPAPAASALLRADSITPWGEGGWHGKVSEL